MSLWSFFTGLLVGYLYAGLLVGDLSWLALETGLIVGVLTGLDLTGLFVGVLTGVDLTGLIVGVLTGLDFGFWVGLKMGFLVGKDEGFFTFDSIVVNVHKKTASTRIITNLANIIGFSKVIQ